MIIFLLGLVMFIMSLAKGELTAAAIFYVGITILWCLETLDINDDYEEDEET